MELMELFIYPTKSQPCWSYILSGCSMFCFNILYAFGEGISGSFAYTRSCSSSWFLLIKSGEICGNITPTPSSWTKTRLSSLETHFLSQTWGKSSKISPSSESAPVCRIWFVFHHKCKTNTLCFSPFTQLCLTTRRKAKTHWISHKCNTRYRNNKVSAFLNFLTPHVHCECQRQIFATIWQLSKVTSTRPCLWMKGIWWRCIGGEPVEWHWVK